ncbi:MAG: hypothetical protein LKJ31_02010 [Atopobiaceae bacterium]|nr:hypothetical protein [Atopobiaceae bacterium]
MLEVVEVVVEHAAALAREGAGPVVERDGAGRVDVLAADHEVDGAAELVGDGPGVGHGDAALRRLGRPFVAGVGGLGDAELGGEHLRAGVAGAPPEPLQGPPAGSDGAVPALVRVRAGGR